MADAYCLCRHYPAPPLERASSGEAVLSLLDLWNPPKPPEPKNVTYAHVLMRTYGAEDHLTPEQRRAKKATEERERRRLGK